jgi:hypothetical protein
LRGSLKETLRRLLWNNSKAGIRSRIISSRRPHKTESYSGKAILLSVLNW